MSAQSPGGETFRMLLVPRSSRGHFLLAVFFRVTYDELSERGITRSLLGTDTKKFE